MASRFGLGAGEFGKSIVIKIQEGVCFTPRKGALLVFALWQAVSNVIAGRLLDVGGVISQGAGYWERDSCIGDPIFHDGLITFCSMGWPGFKSTSWLFKRHLANGEGSRNVPTFKAIFTLVCIN
jgi:hypothetical protein